MNVSILTSEQIQKFWSRVDKTNQNGCWEWQGGHKSDGYGVFSIGSNNFEGSHRISWKLTYGDIPEGLHILHKCDNPNCVNPEHLFIGTHLDNIKDKTEKGRAPHGEKHWKAKLSATNVIEIRYLAKQGFNVIILGEKFGVSKDTIYDILKRRTWRHI